MPDFWDTIKSTVKATGGAAYAPVGAVVDLANMPFDDKDDDFGTVVGALGRRTGDVLEPLIDPDTLVGGAVEKTLQGANWLLDNGLNRPMSTLATAATHDTAGGDFFDRDTWSRAWRMSDEMNAGQALANLFIYSSDEFDPFDYENPYQERTSKEHPKQAAGISWTANVAGAILLDPAGVALKGAGVARESIQFARLSPAERANAMKLLTGGSLSSRVDKWIDWTEGQNKLGRSLHAPEILAGTPELRRYGTDPHVVAGLLADANGITDVASRRNAKRRILAVAMGDRSQIARLEQEAQEAPALADALKNMTKGGVLDLDLLGKAPALRTNPVFVKHLEGQLDNLNKNGSVDRFIDEWTSRLQQQLDTQDTLRNAPGAHRVGERAILRENNVGKGRALANAHRTIDARAAQLAERGKAASSVYQAGRYSVPLIAVRTLGKPLELYTKAPVAVSDALRQTHFVGVANLDEWGPAATQIEAMQRLAGVRTDERMELMDRVFIAKTETEKLRLIEEAEARSVAALAARYNETAGRKLGINIDSAFVQEVVARGSASRKSTMANLRGRSYAATEVSAQRAAAMDTAQAAKDGASTTSGRKWTADQVLDDQGIPVHLPLLETQLTNSIPLLDITLADKLMKREYGYLARLSKGWKADAEELDRLYRLKQAGHRGLDGAIRTRAAAMDWAVDGFQRAMRVWKVSVLLRLGYPVRVLMDDHARIWAKMGTRAALMSEMRALGEGLSDVRYNQLDRRVQARREIAELKFRRSELLDFQQSEQMIAWPERAERLKQVNREIGGRRGTLTKLRAQQEAGEDVTEKVERAERQLADREAARDFLIEQMGDLSPDDIAQELADLKGRILLGNKAARPDKRRLGEKSVQVDGVDLDGAFGGQFGDVMRSASGSSHTFDHLLRGIEDRSVRGVMVGSHRTIGATEAGHLEAWADVLNHQIRNSPVAMHFLKGGDAQSFAKWLRSPAGADLRKRLPHFAYDPEDWAERVQTVLFDYIPTEALREAVATGRVSPSQLAKWFPEQGARPAVHGRSAADTLGSSAAARGIGSAINNVMRWLSEVPTDRLSRHPYFSTMYREHAKDALAVRKAGGQTTFTQADLDKITQQARKNALRDVRSTLFDMSAHSHAAHVMRFVSPFAAAHQEALSRWWRIAADRPHVVRRFSQLFDVPRYAGLVVDENGERVEPGELPSSEHRILLQLPKGSVPEEWSQWSLNEASFNLLMPEGPTNPGTGPLVQVPLDWAAQRYADEPAISRIANIFNPYAPQSAMDSLMPATLKRLSAYTYAKTGVDPSLGLGIGMREYNSAFSQEVQDQTVAFQLREGREPSKAEADEIMERAGNEATTRMLHRFLWNSLSPAPAQPQSRYAIIQQGWFQIQTQARVEGRDFDWAYDRFKGKYQAAYLPLLSSSANNPARIDSATPAWVAAVKEYRPVLQKVDPSLTRLVVGSYTHDLLQDNGSLGEYSQQARNYLRDQAVQTGSSETYYGYDEPATALEEGMARRGWEMYNSLTAALDVQAEELGLASYEDSPQLVAIKRAAVEKLKADNWAWEKDYGSIDSTQYERLIDDMRQIAESPQLAKDPTRTDIQVLKQYLAVRDVFAAYFSASLTKGNGGPDSEAQAPVRRLFTAVVDQLVRSNTMFQSYIYDGIVERDPWLLREPVSAEATA